MGSFPSFTKCIYVPLLCHVIFELDFHRVLVRLFSRRVLSSIFLLFSDTRLLLQLVAELKRCQSDIRGLEIQLQQLREQEEEIKSALNGNEEEKEVDESRRATVAVARAALARALSSDGR